VEGHPVLQHSTAHPIGTQRGRQVLRPGPTHGRAPAVGHCATLTGCVCWQQQQQRRPL
jgi:hypothetical protein